MSSLARNLTQVNQFGIPQTAFSDSGHCFEQKGRNSHSKTRFWASHVPSFRGRNSVFKVSRLESEEQNNDSESLPRDNFQIIYFDLVKCTRVAQNWKINKSRTGKRNI